MRWPSRRHADPEAYDLFLKGDYELTQVERSLSVEPLERGAAYYREALARDPRFALAAARLARCRLSRHWYATALSASELDEVKAIVDKALALAPDLAEAHIARGLFEYWGHRRYDSALKQFRRARRASPNNVEDDIRVFGYVYRRQGQWECSLADADGSGRTQSAGPGALQKT